MSALSAPRRRIPTRALPLLLLALPALIVAITVVLEGRTGYDELTRSYPGIATAMTSGLLRTLTELASTVCVGALFYSLFIHARTGRTRFIVDSGAGSELAIVRWSSLIWMCSSLLLIGVDAADLGGQPMARLLQPGALPYLVQASYLPGAWIFVTVLAFAIFCLANLIRSWQTTLYVLVLALLALLAPVVVSRVLVGPNHDWASDAAILGTPATAIWIGTTITMLLRWYRRGTAPSRTTMLRFIRTSVVCAIVVTSSQIVIATVQISGVQNLGHPITALFGAQLLILATLAVLGGTAIHRLRSGKPPRLGALVVASGLLITYLGITVAMTRIPPPVFFAPTSIAQVFLGYDITATPTLFRLLFNWRFSILFTVMSVVGVGLYLWGVLRLRRRGDAWPVGRTIAWTLGWAVIFLTTSTGLGRYSSVSFSLHMLLHMLLNMLGPLLLVLGGAMTLALRATTARSRNELAGPHEWVTALLRWRLTRAMYNPLHVFITFVASYYLLYLTPIFGEALRYHWAHQLMNLEFIFVGYLFYGLVIGVDKPPVELPHIGKLGLVLAAMPFHAFFGVVIMTQTTIIAGLFYSYINAPWMTDLKADQYLGGGIAWAAGEIPLLIVVIALLIQWSRQDSKEARRIDRHTDRGIDDSFEAYNSMLEQLSQRREATGPATPTSLTASKREAP